MPYSTQSRLRTLNATAGRVAGHLLRYGLAGLVLWLGAFKFTAVEAQAIEPLIRHSPVLSWLYALTDVRGASRFIGGVEMVIALLIALRPVAPRLAAAGSLGAVAMFLTTLSFLATTPGMWEHVEGLVVPSMAGAFLVKDVFLLGAALWSVAEALEASAPKARLIKTHPRRSGRHAPYPHMACIHLALALLLAPPLVSGTVARTGSESPAPSGER